MSQATRTIRGRAVPAIMYGTAWKEERTEGLVRQALAAGFRAIDTANQRKHYHEAGTGAAIRELIAEGRRGELFLQTKFTFRAGQDERLPYDPAAPIAAQVRQSFASSLEHLGVDYLDSLVLHGPSQRPGVGDADREAWRAMEQICEQGGASMIGVSNVAIDQLEVLWAEARIKPAFVQNRCYANRGWDAEIRAFCDAHDVVYQGFSLLTANRQVREHPTLATIAHDLGITPAQAIFALALRLGMLPLTSTTDPQHMADDLATLSVELPEELSAQILAR